MIMLHNDTPFHSFEWIDMMILGCQMAEFVAIPDPQPGLIGLLLQWVVIERPVDFLGPAGLLGCWVAVPNLAGFFSKDMQIG